MSEFATEGEAERFQSLALFIRPSEHDCQAALSQHLSLKVSRCGPQTRVEVIPLDEIGRAALACG